MIKLEKTEVIGWEHAIRGMRNPKNSWDRSDSVIDIVQGETMGELGPNDHKLMMELAGGGPVHAKYRRMITVYADITAPLYWWKEFDTYKVGTVANSCSTMHKIHDKEFTLEDFSCEHLVGETRECLEDIINLLNKYRALFICKNDKRIDSYTVMTDECYTKYKKDLWWQMIQLLPSSYNQKRTVMLNYEVLANIYEWRKNHKLDEWRELCEWIEKLPYSEIICGPEFLRKNFNVEKPENKPSVEDILTRADAEWYDDPMDHTRTVISRGDEPLSEDEKTLLRRMWENQGIRLRIDFKEE